MKDLLIGFAMAASVMALLYTVGMITPQLRNKAAYEPEHAQQTQTNYNLGH